MAYSKDDSNAEQPKDGFDLIEYPCDYAFKAMCRADKEVPASDYIRKVLKHVVDPQLVLSVNSIASRTGKFESVTVTIRLESREQLEMIYQSIASSERVVMTL